VAWSNSEESRLNRTAAVGMYPSGATLQGVLDMAGNVWEWCLNTLEQPERLQSVGIDASVDGLRVVRGGSWNNFQEDLRVSYRFGDYADFQDDCIGFRLAQDIP
jgi:formylglycine-generating enzyme required for sulfatase activity